MTMYHKMNIMNKKGKGHSSLPLLTHDSFSHAVSLFFPNV